MQAVFIVLLIFFSTNLLAKEPINLKAIFRIKQEALEKSQVMDHIFHLVEVHGPRLTNSPGFRDAAKWVVSRLHDWGVDNAHLEEWGPYGQGWSCSRFSAHLIEPQYETLIGVPLTWSPSTPGVIEGIPIIASFSRNSKRARSLTETSVDRYIQKYKGKLAGQIVLFSNLKEIKKHEAPFFTRFSEEDLKKKSIAPIPRDLKLNSKNHILNKPSIEHSRAHRNRTQQNRLNRFFQKEGVKLLVTPAWRGDGGTVLPRQMGSRDPSHPLPPPSIALTPEHYNRIFRLTIREIPVRLEVEIKTHFYKENQNSFNVIADLPGTAKANELVIIGAHLDSVGLGLGATDNAAGSAVMMEVIRILKNLNLSLDRTVRLALWGGEEQGLLGSRAHIEKHFADLATMALKEGHRNLSAYYNLDNGTGKIRGIYLQKNEMVRPIFSGWFAPFADMGAKTLSIRNTRGTDHVSFDAVGLPGFQFIQDPIEYQTRSHHSNMDVYDRIQPGDLAQAAAIIASFVYHTATRNKRLPRKPLPEPRSTGNFTAPKLP